MSWLAEGLKFISDLAQAGVAVKTQTLPNDPQRMMVIEEGKMRLVDTPYTPPPRQHVVKTIASFAYAYDRWCEDGIEAKRKADGTGYEGRLPTIWADIEKWQLQFFTDEPLRREYVRLSLTPSPQLLLLQSFAAAQVIEQRRLVRILRHDLAGCVDESVLIAFRTVDFEKMENARRTIDTARQSMDADIVAQVRGEKKPEEFEVNFPLFAMKELATVRSSVRLTIDIDCSNQKFILQAKPGHLEQAIDDARAAVAVRLSADLKALSREPEAYEVLDGSPS
jgi:hypothetical protein